MAAKKVKVRITSAVVALGKVQKPKAIIEVEEADAKKLFEREKAVLATDSEPQDGDETEETETETAAAAKPAAKSDSKK